MKRIFAVLTIVPLLVALTFAQSMSPDKNSNPSQNLMDMERKWADAAKAANPAPVDAMLSDNFVNLDSDGTMHAKSDSLERMKKAKWEISEVSDMQVVQNGNTAIVTGTWRGKGTDGMGRPVDSRERFVDTWEQMPDGTWRCVASASAPMKDQSVKE